MRPVIVIAVLLALLAAGCTTRSPDAKGDGTTSETNHPGETPTSSSTAPTGEPPSNDTKPPASLALNDCRGLRVRFVWPTQATPTGSEVPQGWEGTSEPTVSEHLMIIECARVSVGPFERGPIKFLLETHDAITPPAPCREYADGGGLPAHVIRSIWFDDAELVIYLAQTLGLPARFGEFTYEATDVPTFSLRKWTWNEPDGPVSELTYERSDTPVGNGPEARRLFWQNGASVSLMDWEWFDEQPLVTPGNVVGWLRSPMMHADSGVEFYDSALSTLVDPGAYYTGAIQSFGDLQCKQPLA